MNDIARIILKKDKKILLVKRNEKIGFGLWQFPGGHLDKQSPRKAILRELAEETGIKKISKLKYHRKVKSPYTKGKRTHIFTASVFTYPKIKLQAEEISDYKWIKPHQIKKMKTTKTTKLFGDLL